MSVRSHLKNHMSKFHELMYLFPVAVARSCSDDNVIRYVLPVLWMTSRFPTTKGIGRIKDDVYVSSSSPGGGTSRTSETVVWSRQRGGGTGGEVCCLRLHLVFVTVLLPYRSVEYTKPKAHDKRFIHCSILIGREPVGERNLMICLWIERSTTLRQKACHLSSHSNSLAPSVWRIKH